MILKNLSLNAVVSAHFPNVMTTQQLENICVTNKPQVTCHGLSYEVVYFLSLTVPRETLNCAKRFTVVREERTAG